MEVKSAREIKEMLSWLDGKISEWEERHMEAGVGTWMDSIQHETSRREYAGWLAERSFLADLQKRLYGIG